jgi:hypothetical protein
MVMKDLKIEPMKSSYDFRFNRVKGKLMWNEKLRFKITKFINKMEGLSR